ncbi:VanW family protein [Snodgrassella sp. B3882]|nr:VanW family protein [Snodgrassella sp. B3882]
MGDSDIQLQYNQVINLKIAVDSLNGILIKSGKYFSLCRLVGKQQRGEDLGMEWNFRLAQLVPVLAVESARSVIQFIGGSPFRTSTSRTGKT